MQSKENEQFRDPIPDDVKKKIFVGAFNMCLKSITLVTNPLGKVGITLATLAISKGTDMVIENRKNKRKKITKK